MSDSNKPSRITMLFMKFIILAIICFSGLWAAVGGWQPGFAQVADWCGQPGILWCTSHEEFAIGDNLNTGSSFGSQNQYKSWYSGTVQTTGGYVDRNEYNYPNPPYSPQDVLNNLQATITQASMTIPARSGETSAKKYLSFWNKTDFAQPSNPQDRFSSGIFLTRKLTGGLTNYMTTYPEGLYYSSWYWFPTNYTSTNTSNNNLMVMEFMTEIETTSTKKWRVPWSIHIQGRANNKMAFRVDDRSASLSSNDAYSETLVQINNSAIPDIPIGKWVHLEVLYKFGELTSIVNGNQGAGLGQMLIFQDGLEIYRFDSVATKPQAGITIKNFNWVVDSYAFEPVANSTNNQGKFHFYTNEHQ